MSSESDPNEPLSQEPTPPLEPKKDAWTNRFTGIWNDATSRLTQILPINQATQTFISWFSVSEEQVAEILAAVRAQLPTTEALLIGKPQAGKSSIVRGLTGVSADIIGQGFRPHTQHTERYAYPSEDLPLLIFTDTVGLGDVNRETQTIIQELSNDLKQESQGARVLILTIKINDFATDTLRQIAQQLRSAYPNIPCLLAVTCLHEVYPATQNDHPPYPPEVEAVNRAFAAIQETFKGLCDRAVLIDFTLEEDGYTPVFYGLEAFRDNLAELLPEAESRAIHQLLEGGVGEQLGTLYRDVGRRYILAFSIGAATLAAVPLPFATMPVLTALQVSLVGLLGKLYGQTLTPSQAGGVASAIAGGFFAQAIGRELVKFIPGLGSAIAASWAAAYTWALGEGALVYFGDLMGGKKPDPQKIQAVMKEAFQTAKERFKGS
ncbi:50S ribosome-binding GTPase [Desertifilum sp. FACHB-1129]|uniref:G domain-containing protein n=1 Tax=Desertifilum tharense IPPAS B-1220 TaxID=1781255 RepID=A0A1E5QJP3_9CYAN|nr:MULTISPECIES: GTPase [Desertifilum]MCD8488591.1 50S ribosome-binding GTPase [Desertifilum sp.]MDA0211389.1 50S ribosome-binding GTPase [Cyanobacteria bacterium FC1]MBD2313566.1 50S ribosome-binding GTPase [Desertifilum sp. FACHB-1129]MBD2323898.1 50S ribosome-binding GTPase [Desertifilum sp. FACHB-866]MBD2333743.1 50S ribosome-binding GTPase [Desertifilum sp. FACHB-868]